MKEAKSKSRIFMDQYLAAKRVPQVTPRSPMWFKVRFQWLRIFSFLASCHHAAITFRIKLSAFCSKLLLINESRLATLERFKKSTLDSSCCAARSKRNCRAVRDHARKTAMGVASM